MNSRSLIHWANVEERRRKQHGTGLQSRSGVAMSVLLGLLLTGEMTRRLLMAKDEGTTIAAVLGASQLWIAVAVCGYAIGVFGAPFRLYWRRDSKLLASLPVPGASLFALAVWRSQRVALLVSLALCLALVPLGVLVDWQLATRHVLVLVVGFAGSAWLGPAAALSAGAIVASDKAQAMIASMSGEFQAPRTSWLGIMPGLAATAVAVAVISCAPWVVGGRPPGGSALLIAGLGVGVPAALVGWAWTRADRVIPAAVREVAALDQEILAHIDKSTPSWLERRFFGVLLPSSRLLAVKDASMLRRRYPSPYFMIPVGIAVLWIVAAIQPDRYLPWGGALYGGLLVYAMVMARRTWVSPVEIPQLLRALPLSPKQVARAKNLQAILRILMVGVFGGAPIVFRAPDLASTGIFVVLGALVSVSLSARFTPSE